MVRGRKPKPTHLKLLAGNPGKRPLNDREAKPRPKLPPAPRNLSDEARREWYRMGKRLVGLGLMTEIDKGALAIYCANWARFIEAEQMLRETSTVVNTPMGPILNPYLSIANKATDRMARILGEFGMTPSSRSRIKVADEIEKEKGLLD